jgi:hypothetical protein
MSIIKTIPKTSIFKQSTVRFVAPFNDPSALGAYTFGLAPNQGQVIVDNLGHTSVYMIERYNFSASMAEETYLSALNAGVAVVPSMILKKRNDQSVVYENPIPLVKYTENQESIAYFKTRQDGDALLVDIAGILNQVTALVGIAAIQCQVSFTIYRVTDNKWIQRYNAATQDSEVAYI